MSQKGDGMDQNISWVENTAVQANPNPEAGASLIDPSVIAEVKQFHASFSEYQPTPLRSLSALAARWGIAGIQVKDESLRFGLNAFKVLGASYAMGKSLAKRLGRPLSELPFPVLKTPAIRQSLGDPVFAATTDGNHGRGVAWTAAQLGFSSHIFMPKGTTQTRYENIRALGGGVRITDMNYDDTVRWVAGQAREKNWEIIQDTAWDGYVDVPRWIMQGYSTVGREAIDQAGAEVPSHVFLQAGVGAFAAVMAVMVRQAWPHQPPCIVILEAKPAECFYESIKAGRKTAVSGDLDTIMAGLACGEPNPLAWDILRDCGAAFAACPDWVAAQGMRILGNPVGSDDRVVSGESGAVGIGLLEAALTDPAYAGLRSAIGLTEQSRVMLFSTEGDTDPAIYRRVVWGGEWPKTAAGSQA